MNINFVNRDILDFIVEATMKASLGLNIAFPSRVLSLIIRQCIDTMRNCSPYAVKTDRRA